jgi:hypothetical protein
MNSLSPIFIVSSGRSGTYAIVNALKNAEDTIIHHEFLFELVLKNAVLYKMELISDAEIKEILTETYFAANFYAKGKLWIDCSNALPWIIFPLLEMFPSAKFIHLVRDGRKVVSSFYNKFRSLMYSDECVNDMLCWVKDRKNYPMPPAEKKYWRPIPLYDETLFKSFLEYNQFQRICFYWSELNMHIGDALSNLSPMQKMTIKFEDLLADEVVKKEFTEFINIEYSPNMYNAFKRPVNVHKPQNYKLNAVQQEQFDAICSGMMEKYGYKNTEEYDVKY